MSQAIEKQVIADLNEQLIEAQSEVHRLQRDLKIARGEIAGYKLGTRLLNRFCRSSLNFCVYAAKTAARFA